MITASIIFVGDFKQLGGRALHGGVKKIYFRRTGTLRFRRGLLPSVKLGKRLDITVLSPPVAVEA